MTAPVQNDLPVQADNVTLHYGAQAVLKQVSLHLPAGTVVGLVGRNGAGKSSLLRCLAGLTLPSSGHCSLFGCPSATLSDDIRARLGFVSQGGDLLPWLTTAQHLRYIGSFYPNWQEARVRALCTRLDLPWDKKASTLSVGDQQKLALVLALGHDPDLLLLDEPVSSLDPMARREFMRFLFEVDASRTTPRTVLLSSHLLSDLERVVSHVVFLRDGQVQLQGAWDDLLESVRRVEFETALPSTAVGVLAQRSLGSGRHQVIVDSRCATPYGASGSPLSLEDLFVELNSGQMVCAPTQEAFSC
ncbi:MAG: ABC transporter ATP-binding protein [Burkholderiales bacterium]